MKTLTMPSAAKKAEPKMVCCKWHSCMKTFPARGPKRFCSQAHQIKAHRQKNKRKRPVDLLRQAAIERDGGCVRRVFAVEVEEFIDLYIDPNYGKEKPETEVEAANEALRARMTYNEIQAATCSRGKLFVRRIDPTKPRTLDNVETLCGHHHGMVSAARFCRRVGPEAYKAAKKRQGLAYAVTRREVKIMRDLRTKLIRFHRGVPKNPLDFIDYI